MKKSVKSVHLCEIPACRQAGVIQTNYDIVKAHGGEIIVESIEGEGTEFIITIPIKS
jgi:hypothetical protein